MERTFDMVDLRTHLTEKGVEQELRRLIFNIASTSKYISSKINESNRKLAGSKNTFGEEQLELDKAADKILMQRFDHSNLVKQFASEEQGEIRTFEGPGRYSVAIDPVVSDAPRARSEGQPAIHGSDGGTALLLRLRVGRGARL